MDFYLKKNLTRGILKSQKLKYDGVMIETHDNPEKALSDSKQQIKPVEFNSFFINE